MATVFASGTLSGAEDFVDISLEGKYTGAFGLLLSGTFGTGPGEVQPMLGGYKSTRGFILLDPADSSNQVLTFAEAGLFHFEGFGSHIRLYMSSGEAGVTAIDYKLFLKPRP